MNITIHALQLCLSPALLLAFSCLYCTIVNVLGKNILKCYHSVSQRITKDNHNTNDPLSI